MAAIATMMRGTIKRVTTTHRQMSIMHKRFLSSSSVSSTCSSTKYSVVDHNPDNSWMRQNDIPKSTKDGNTWLEVDMGTKSQKNIVPKHTQSWPDESTIAKKMDWMPMFDWSDEEYEFFDGCIDTDDDGMYVKILVPELGKEDIKEIQVEQKHIDTSDAEEYLSDPEVDDEGKILEIHMRGKVLRKGANGEGEVLEDYSTPFYVKPEIYEMGGVWAQVKHGVLRIFIPRVKPAEIKEGVFEVNLA